LGPLLAVDIFGQKRPFAYHARASVGLEPPKKTALIAFVANPRAKWLNKQQQCVGVAIKAKLAQTQNVAADLSFFPKPVS
jgi:hypothetical protein